MKNLKKLAEENEKIAFALSLVSKAKLSGYKKCSLLLSFSGDEVFFPCIVCDVEKKDIGAASLYLPENKEERSFVYFVCESCNSNLMGMSEEQRREILEGIEVKLEHLRDVALIRGKLVKA